MRDVNQGWLLRYLHANGASFFFIVTYIHIFRGLYYGSYKAPREMVWMLGLVIFLLMMATAFMGYVLPWGQMSFWAAKVITGLFGAIPLDRRADPELAARRLCARPADAEPLLLAPLSAAVRDRGRDHPPHLGAAHSGLGQPDRSRREGAAGHGALPSLLHRQGRLRRRRLPDPARDRHLLRCPIFSATPTITSRPTRSRRRRTSCPNGISGPSTRSCAPSPSTSSCRPSCGACWRCSPRSCCSSSCPGSTSRRCARAATGRPSASSSGSWSLDILVLGWCGGLPAEEPYVMISQVATIYYFAHFLIILPILSMVERTDAAAQLDLGMRAARRGGRSGAGRRQARHGGRGIRGREEWSASSASWSASASSCVAAWSLLWGVIAVMDEGLPADRRARVPRASARRRLLLRRPVRPL